MRHFYRFLKKVAYEATYALFMFSILCGILYGLANGMECLVEPDGGIDG